MNIRFNYDKSMKESNEINKKINKNKDKILFEIGLEGKTQVQSNITTYPEHPPIDTGTFIKSIAFKTEGDKVIVHDGVKYGADIEFGTPPGRRVSLTKLKKWVHRKLKPESEQAEFAIAKTIQQKIFEEGTDPRPVFQPLDNQMPPKIVKIIKKHT